MTFLSQRTLTRVEREYRQSFVQTALPVSVRGELARRAPRASEIFRLPAAVQTCAYSLQEAVHWGEPYVFYWTPQIVGWVVALVDQHQVQGGLLGGAVLAPGTAPADAVQSLIDQGFRRSAAERYVARLPVWPPARIREAALFLQKTFYQFSGWKPLLLEENRLKAAQQRQIAEAIDEQKKKRPTAYPIDKERLLLSLIRAGDQNGARRVLNEMLGAMFLFNPKLVVLRARAIEMMGYLTRAAIEDSPLLEPLIERNHQWMQRLIQARDFETLAHVLMQALDDFMAGIYMHGFNCYNPTVSRILDHLTRHYTEPITLAQVAAAVQLGPFRVSHLLKQHTGKSMLQHVMQLRIQKAQQLLERSTKSCPEIAYAAGFCDQSYFIKHFKRLTGITPARFRRRRLSPTAPETETPNSNIQIPT